MRPKVRRTCTALAALAAAAVTGVGTASADPGTDAATNVWSHGGSNMGECSAYLAQLDVPDAGSVRASVNHVIQQYGAFLGLSSPGDLYSVRARQAGNLAPAQECLPRRLPGGGTG